MGHKGDRRKLPPLPWTWQSERNGYVVIYDAEGYKIGAFWGDAGRCFAAAKFIEWVTARYGERLNAEFQPEEENAEIKRRRDERARVRGLAMKRANG
jgi:hypothetical protein